MNSLSVITRTHSRFSASSSNSRSSHPSSYTLSWVPGHSPSFSPSSANKARRFPSPASRRSSSTTASGSQNGMACRSAPLIGNTSMLSPSEPPAVKYPRLSSSRTPALSKLLSSTIVYPTPARFSGPTSSGSHTRSVSHIPRGSAPSRPLICSVSARIWPT